MKVFDVSGDHYRMGFQHARQVSAMRLKIHQAMKDRLSLLEKLPADVQPYQQELLEMWEANDQPIIGMLKGLADGLGLDWDQFFRYSIATYLCDLTQKPIPGQGCTSWAASGLLTSDQSPILAKNRDYRPNHRRLQCLVQASPAVGYRYTYLTSAGSPGVFSSGMNEKGLAVVDTHVTSTDTGPGLARYSVMMRILEHFSGVNEALEYLQSIVHIGDGTLTLIDAEGETAVFEAGHSNQGIVWPEKGYVVATNHYVSPGLSEKWLDICPLNQKGNTRYRYTAVHSALQAAEGNVNFTWARELMASHTTPLEALCRHPEYEPASVTISTVFFLPRTRTVLVADGLPCRTGFHAIRLNGEP